MELFAPQILNHCHEVQVNADVIVHILLLKLEHMYENHCYVSKSNVCSKVACIWLQNMAFIEQNFSTRGVCKSSCTSCPKWCLLDV